MVTVERHVDVSLNYASHYGTHSKLFKQNAIISCATGSINVKRTDKHETMC